MVKSYGFLVVAGPGEIGTETRGLDAWEGGEAAIESIAEPQLLFGLLVFRIRQ